MEKSIEEILDSISNNWDKRQSWLWRIKNKIVYKFMRRLYDKNVPETIPDPAIDEESETFSFFAHPNMQLGLPNENAATRVDSDGQLDTGAGKYVFFRGTPIERIQKRIWTLTDGYLPEINYSIEKFNIKYSFKAFQYWLDESAREHPINFIEVEVDNLIEETVNDDLYLGVLFNPFKHKIFNYKRSKFRKNWLYKFNEDNVPVRNGKLLYFHEEEQPVNLFSKITHDEKLKTYKVIPYKGPFKGKRYNIQHDTISLIEQFRFHIGPLGSKKFVFKIPQHPFDEDAEKLIQRIKQTNINRIRRKFRAYWEDILERSTNIEVPEKKVTNASKASLIYCFMGQNYHINEEKVKSTDEKDTIGQNLIKRADSLEQHVNRFQYNDFWIRDSAFFAKMYSCFNRTDISKKLLLFFLTQQKKNGNFMSQKGQLDGWGQALWAFGEYLKYTKDKEFAEIIFTPLMEAIDFFEDLIADDDWGIMPPVFAADNEMISGRYTGHNFWAWCGLNNAQYIAEFIQRKREANRIEQIKSQFLSSFIPILNLVSKHHDHCVPPGLDTDLGEDWSNLLMLYPQKLLDKKELKVLQTLKSYRAEKMPERIATWMVFNHHYITERIAQQQIILDNQKKALSDFYGMLSHTGACHEGFEHNIKPWGNRHYLIPIKVLFWQKDFFNFPPHGWFAVAYNILLRNMLIREEKDDLHLLSVISPKWVSGPINITNAKTYFGLCNVTLSSQEENVLLSFSSLFKKRSPANIIVHIPYFVDKKTIEVQSEVEYQFDEKKTQIVIPPRKEFSLTISWQVDNNADLSYTSYEKSVEWLKKKYKKKYQQKHKN